MRATHLTRRNFAQVLGGALGVCVLAPRLSRAGTWAIPVAHRHANLPAGAVRIDSNENPYGPSPKALEAMSRSQRISARYPDALEDEVTSALAAMHRVDPDQVILGCGSGEVLRMADMAFLAPGKNVVAAEPTFEAVLAFARVTRADPIKVPLTSDYRHDLVRMAAACNEATGLVYLCNPNNPTGTIVRKDEMGTFFQRVPRKTVILVDEAYFHFVEDERYASAFEWTAKCPNLLVVRTFSKIYGLAGMRLGYGVGSREIIAAMRPHRIWSNANASVLEAALASLADTGNVAQCRRVINGTRQSLCDEMEKDGRAVIPSDANFLMIDVGSDVQPVITALQQRNILVGRKFPSLPNWLRVSMGTPEEMQQFVAALREVVPARPAQARPA
jgi:histidinol-phosphate aminotransferase